jgi:hypothetical protein
MVATKRLATKLLWQMEQISSLWSTRIINMMPLLYRTWLTPC